MTNVQRSQLRHIILEQQRLHAGNAHRPRKPEINSKRDVGSTEDEQPLNEMLQVIASNRNQSDDGLRARLDRALAKLRDSPEELGECEECGEEIPFARLRVMPYAEYCVSCQQRRDGPNELPTRRWLTDFK